LTAVEEPKSPIALSRKQFKVVQQLLTGATDKQIAELLGVSPRTVSNTLSHVYDKTGVSRRAHLVALFMRGLLIEIGQRAQD
jgi:DNA-binding CsgD family transcriptional regulator